MQERQRERRLQQRRGQRHTWSLTGSPGPRAGPRRTPPACLLATRRLSLSACSGSPLEVNALSKGEQDLISYGWELRLPPASTSLIASASRSCSVDIACPATGGVP